MSETCNFNVVLDKPVYDRLHAEKKATELSFRVILRRALQDYFAKQDGKSKRERATA